MEFRLLCKGGKPYSGPRWIRSSGITVMCLLLSPIIGLLFKMFCKNPHLVKGLCVLISEKKILRDEFWKGEWDKDSKNGCFERVPYSDYHLPVNRVHGHHFQNEFYWLDVARYFVNPYSCSSRVHWRLDFFFFFPSLNWGKIRHWGDDQNLFFIWAKINVSLVSMSPAVKEGEKPANRKIFPLWSGG